MGNKNAAGPRGGRKKLYGFGVNKKTRNSIDKISKSVNAKWKLQAVHHVANTSTLRKHKTIARYIKSKYKV